MSHESSLRSWLLLTPALAVIALLFVGGIGVGVAQSLHYMPVLGWHTPTFAHYVAVLSSGDFYRSLLLTLYIATTSTVLAAVLAVFVALVLRRVDRGRQLYTFIFQIPLPVPHLVAAAGIVMLVSQSGLFARMLYALGGLEQPSDFPVLVFDRRNVGTILVYLWKEIPFVGLVVLAVLQGVGQSYEEAARTLGANRWQRFRYVLLPLLLPGIVSTSIIVFAFVFGSFEIPLLLGARYPSVLPVMAYRAYTDPDLARRPEAMAIGVIITLIIIGLMALYRAVARRVVR